MQSFDGNNFIAPQNSTVEGYKIPRYKNDPFKECNSAPPTVTTTPYNSKHSLNKKRLSSGKESEVWWANEDYVPKPREFKDGISIQNNLQGRLYNLPNSKHIEKTSFGKCINTFVPRKKNIERLSKKSKEIEKTNNDKAKIEDQNLMKSPQEEVVHEATTSEHSDDETNDTPVFQILYKFYKRLGWPTDGLLQGKIQKKDDKSIDTQIKICQDDGEFVYCLLRYGGLKNPKYDPYDLVPVSSNEIQKNKLYYTISASYITKVYVLSTILTASLWALFFGHLLDLF